MCLPGLRANSACWSAACGQASSLSRLLSHSVCQPDDGPGSNGWWGVGGTGHGPRIAGWAARNIRYSPENEKVSPGKARGNRSSGRLAHAAGFLAGTHCRCRVGRDGFCGCISDAFAVVAGAGCSVAGAGRRRQAGGFWRSCSTNRSAAGLSSSRQCRRLCVTGCGRVADSQRRACGRFRGIPTESGKLSKQSCGCGLRFGSGSGTFRRLAGNGDQAICSGLRSSGISSREAPTARVAGPVS